MISIDVLSCPGQLRHICPKWLKLENPPKISQCTPEKFHNIRNKQEAILNTPPENPSNVSLFFFQNSSNNDLLSSKTTHPPNLNLRITQSDWHLICFLSFSCSSVNAENHVIHLRGEAEYLEPSPPFFPQVMWCPSHPEINEEIAKPRNKPTVILPIKEC